jgi:hypothetical protein
MDRYETTDLRARRLERIAAIAGITLVMLMVLVLGIYFGASVILFPTMG